MDHDTIRMALLENDSEFQNLHQEHQNCEGLLHSLNERSFLSPDDETEAKRIKVHKLALKDRMESLIRSRAQASN